MDTCNPKICRSQISTDGTGIAHGSRSGPDQYELNYLHNYIILDTEKRIHIYFVAGPADRTAAAEWPPLARRFQRGAEQHRHSN